MTNISLKGLNQNEIITLVAILNKIEFSDITVDRARRLLNGEKLDPIMLPELLYIAKSTLKEGENWTKYPLNLVQYQEKAVETAIYGTGNAINYPILGLVGEAGELANKYKKVLRDNGGVMEHEKKVEIAKELGDVLWYCAALARDLGTNLEVIANENLLKLAARKEKGTLQGSGDNR